MEEFVTPREHISVVGRECCVLSFGQRQAFNSGLTLQKVGITDMLFIGRRTCNAESTKIYIS